MQENWLTYKQSRVRYLVFGTGNQPVVCFHGYGESAGLYQFLGTQAGSGFRFIAIDLPFHGATEWKEGPAFDAPDLVAIIAGIIEVLYSGEMINADKRNGVIVMGFSLGGRVALSLYQASPSLFSRMILLAPDGLRVNGWYWLATQTWIGNRLFKFTMKHPRWFFVSLRLLNKMGVVNASIFKFVNFYIGDPVARDLLYKRWTCLRRLRPDLLLIRKSIREHHTQVRLVYGSHDRIILPRRGEDFRKGIEEYTTLKVIASGHQVLQEKYAGEIIRTLTD